jgi:alpha-ketoglutarate-dependent taurine dioxygenase
MKITRLGGALGAEIRGVDLARLDEATGVPFAKRFTST